MGGKLYLSDIVVLMTWGDVEYSRGVFVRSCGLGDRVRFIWDGLAESLDGLGDYCNEGGKI